MSMKMSENGKRKLTEWEGSESHTYQDVKGLWTIGVGHLMTQDEITSGKILIGDQSIRHGDGLTEQQILDLLAQDLVRFEEAVNGSVTVELTQGQFDALVSFGFNVGTGAFKDSTLLKVLNQGEYDEVPTQLRRWVYAAGNVIQGLKNRRENEIALWNS